MTETADNMILKGKDAWNSWKQNNHHVHFARPHWHKSDDGRGISIKGRNDLDFSGMDFSNVSVHSAFAEGLKLVGATFVNTHFEEGDFSRADFSNATFVNTKFNKTILTKAIFDGATFLNCNLNRVNLTDARFCVKQIKETVVYGISAWDLRTCEQMEQSRLVIDKTYDLYSELIARGEVPTTVDDIEMAQFVYFLANHKKLRGVLNMYNERGVLLLGRFNDGGLERLYTIYDWLKQKGYMPMIFDFDRPSGMDYSETVVTMAGLAKFFIADLSGSSVPHEVSKITDRFMKPLLAFYTDKAYSMFADVLRKPWVRSFQLDNPEMLIESLEAHLPEVQSIHQQIVADLAKSHPVAEG